MLNLLRGAGSHLRKAYGWPVVGLVAVFVVAAPGLALAAFPGTNPNESVRINTPNDPDFDHCESDDESGPPTCTSVFDEQFERFGFAPNGSENTALYHNPLDPHVQRMMAQNTLAGRNPLGQVPGVSADRAWKYSTGHPSVQIAILDTGIRWDKTSLRKRVWLNRDELPLPQHPDSTPCSTYDCNGDGAFNVDDYANDPRVSIAAGGDDEPSADSILDGSDLIATFSDGTDDDSNGFVDDITGWDFFDNDNNPYDASSYSSASNHGSGRAENAAEEGNEASGGLGVCPSCQVVPMRVWDTFVVDTNNFAQAVLYAADNNIEVVEGAVGALFNSRFAQKAFDYAYRRGVLLAIVSSDLNTADHNVPTTYNEAMMVQGTVSDVHGLGQEPPQEFIDFFNQAGVPFQSNAPIGTWFRNSGTTQYGGHAHIVMPAVTGSEATGQASGAAGLIASYAREQGIPLQPNEIKQLLTMTAFDVTAPDTAGLGTPDPAQAGWDQHFGYGLPDLGLALERIDQNKIPPQALITSPDWFAPLNVDQQAFVTISGRISASRTSGYSYKLQWAPGIEPVEGDFVDVTNSVSTTPMNGALGTISLEDVRAALDARAGGGATVDATAPSKGPGDKDPNEPAFTVRVVLVDALGNRAEDRKVLFDYHDTTLHQGWSKNLGSGGEASQRLFDLNGDNKLDTVIADSSGDLQVLNADGTPLQSFNNGQPVHTALYPNVHPGAAAYSSLDPPREVLRTPSIGDIDGDREPEIVASAGEHVFAWHSDGTAVTGFPVRLDPNFSRPQDRTRANHVKRGFTASPVLTDLSGDGKLDITIAGLDQHLYAWDGLGSPLTGFPKLLRDPTQAGAEIINTPAVGDIDGDGDPEIVSPTAEFDDNPSAPQTPGGGAAGGFSNILTNILANVLGGSSRVYAVDNSGNVLPGWPISPNGVVPDALPFVGPGVDQILADVNGDSTLDVVGNIATGDVTATGPNGANLVQYDSQPPGGDTVDKSRVLNLFENPIAANLDGVPGLEIIKGGVTLNGLVNLGVAVGQNLPYNHVVQAWNAQTGASLPSFPQAVEDYQLLSSPTVADVSDAPGSEIIVGTGLYLIRNINVAGVEGTGWPKFTGGWNFATPAIGDADGDGQLEVTATTREGYGFMWDTNTPACGTNDEWWTSRHDEWNTGAYGTDTRPPGTPRNLTVTRNGDSATLSWTAPGDDWLCGTATQYRIIKSNSPIVHPSDGTVVGDFSVSQAAGGTETQSVNVTGASYVAVLEKDDNGNWGHLAGAVVPPSHPQSALSIDSSLVPAFKECGTPARQPTLQHAPPFGGSCAPATVGVAHVGSQSVESAKLTVIPGDLGTAPNDADVRFEANATDIRSSSATGTDYNPNPGGADLTLVPRLRITDTANGASASDPGTATDLDFPVPVDCANTVSPGIGATCSVNTTANAVMPGVVVEGRSSIWQTFRLRVTDSGVDGQRANGDDRLFLQQGIFAP